MNAAQQKTAKGTGTGSGTSVEAAGTGVLANELMTGLTGAVPTFGGRRVIVGFHGEQAFHSPKHGYVNIPALPRSKIIPARIARQIRGFAMHESAHVLFTDSDVLENGRTDAEKEDDLLKETWNAIEDYMIESFFLEVYPGAHKNFSSTAAWSCSKYLEKHDQDPEIANDMRRIGPVALTWARFIHLGYQTPLPRDCIDTLPHHLQVKTWDWFDRIVDVASTQECLDAARQIAKEIRADPHDPGDPPRSSGNQGTGTGPRSPKNQSNGGDPKGDPVDPTSDGGDPKGDPVDPTSDGDDQTITPMPVGNNVRDMMEEGDIRPDPGVRSFPVLSTPDDGPAAEVLADPQGAQRARTIRSEVSSTTNTVARVLRRSLKAMARPRTKSGRMSGNLDTKRLAEAATGKQEVHLKRRSGEKIDTAVSILIDCSGSMDDGKLDVCSRLGLVLHDALEGTPIQFEILGYTSARDSDLPHDARIIAEAAAENAPDVDVKVRGVSLYEFKPFGSSSTETLKTVGNIAKSPCGGTPTSDAIYMAHSRLAARPERRHVMLVLTDGDPDDTKECRRAVRALESCNVTTVGIGIASSAVQGTFNDAIQVDRVDDLSNKVIDKLAGILAGDKLKRAVRPRNTPPSVVNA